MHETKPDQLPEDERKKFEKEFEDYREKLDRAKEEYKKEHPDKRTEVYEDEDKLFEQPETRELKMILDGQNEIYRSLKTLLVKLDEVVGRQERELSLLTMISQAQPQVPPSDQKQISSSGSIQRHEVDNLLNSQQDIVGTVRDVRSLVSDVHSRLKTFPGSTASDDQRTQDTKNYLAAIQADVKSLLSKSKEVNCPTTETPVSCVTTSTLFLLLAAQLGAIIGYFMYRSSREAAAKKFF